MGDPVRDDPLDSAFRERLVAFLDGELAPAEMREMAERLARDPAARAAADEQRALWASLGAYRDEPVPPGFSARVLEAAGVPPPAGAARPFALLRGGRARRVAVAAALLVAAGAGMWLGRRTAPVVAPSDAARAIEPPAEVLSVDDLAAFAMLSDEDFEVILAGSPDDLADVATGG